VEAYRALLAPDEASRHQAFRGDARRHEHLVSRALVRWVLSRYRPVSPREWRFRTNAHGRPEVDATPPLRFNLSNCPELVVCAVVGAGEIGIDAEPVDRAEQVLRLAPRFLSPPEQVALAALPGEAARRGRALLLWTIKEAYAKALGVGLSLPLQDATFTVGDAGGVALGTDVAEGSWHLATVEIVDHRVSCAARAVGAGAITYRVWEATPLLGAQARPDLAARLGRTAG